MLHRIVLIFMLGEAMEPENGLRYRSVLLITKNQQ
jgi:hypothetical protein